MAISMGGQKTFLAKVLYILGCKVGVDRYGRLQNLSVRCSSHTEENMSRGQTCKAQKCIQVKKKRSRRGKDWILGESQGCQKGDGTSF